MAQLRDALPLAATAAGEAGQYQALMATLDESDHLPESLLVHALGAQCARGASPATALTPTPPPTAETPRRTRPRPGSEPRRPDWDGDRVRHVPTDTASGPEGPGTDTRSHRAAWRRPGAAQTEGLKPAGRLMDFFSRNSSRPSGPNSRPMPDSL